LRLGALLPGPMQQVEDRVPGAADLLVLVTLGEPETPCPRRQSASRRNPHPGQY
jgi:hypothetical protein